MPSTLIDWILHLDHYLALLAADHGTLAYAVLFGVIFIETGLVAMPFLPGDSLLFVAGALAAKGMFSLPLLGALLIVAAIAGDAVNFAAGSFMRNKLAHGHRPRFIKRAYLDRTEQFFERHGRKTIILARWVPIVRTLAPFVAAVGGMHYPTFLAYNVIGAVAWVGSLLGAGYAFGNIDWVSRNLTAVLLGIIALSLLPGVLAWARAALRNKGDTA